MNAKTIGLAIVVIGLIMTLYTGFTYVTREKIVDIGSVEITADKDHTCNLVSIYRNRYNGNRWSSFFVW